MDVHSNSFLDLMLIEIVFFSFGNLAQHGVATDAASTIQFTEIAFCLISLQRLHFVYSSVHLRQETFVGEQLRDVTVELKELELFQWMCIPLHFYSLF